MPNAQLSYTFAQLKAAALHALGRNPSAGELAGPIVNRALEYLCVCHSWSWRNSLLDLDFNGGDGTIALPADFGEIITLARHASSRTPKATSMADLLKRRAESADDGKLYWCLSGADVRSLQMVPIPDEDLEAALTLAYRGIVPTLVEEDDTPVLPPGYAGLLYQLVRCFAHTSHEAGSPEESPEWSLAAQMLDSAKRADANAGGDETGIALKDQTED
jgi:hypothetical protein